MPANWIIDGAWSLWPAPQDLIAGEGRDDDVLAMTAGPPRKLGYLIPVEVTLVRETSNRVDRTAIRAELDGQRIGYLRRSVAESVAPQIDSVGCRSFVVCGILRGGSLEAPDLGVHVWLDRRLTPGPVIFLSPDPTRTSTWPPWDGAGDHRSNGSSNGSSNETHSIESAAPTIRLDLSDFMPREREAEVFTLDSNGLPTGALERHAGRLVIVPDGHPDEIVNPRSTRTYRLGIYSLGLRRTQFHDENVLRADLRPGRKVQLVREPKNEFDPHAIAVYTGYGRRKIGYVNRLNAKRIAPLLDSGADLAAITTHGDAPGRDLSPVMILVARRDVLAHLMRRL